LTHEHTVVPFGGPLGTCPSPPATQNPIYQYSYQPRIDAPDHSEDSWSVIVQQSETYDICPDFSQVTVNAAYKINGGGIQDIILNDFSLSGTVKMSDWNDGDLYIS